MVPATIVNKITDRGIPMPARPYKNFCPGEILFCICNTLTRKKIVTGSKKIVLRAVEEAWKDSIEYIPPLAKYASTELAISCTKGMWPNIDR